MTTPTIESIFLAALKTGPVTIIDNMKDRTHAATGDPLVVHSPLVRLAILAVDLGADPERVWFNHSPTRTREAAAAMYNVGADDPVLTSVLRSGLPAIGFHFCSLNGMYFIDEVGLYGQRVKTSRQEGDNPKVLQPFVWFEPQAAAFDRANPAHMRVVRRIHVHFNNNGWHTAAERLEKCLQPPTPAVSDPEVQRLAVASNKVDARGTDPARAAAGFNQSLDAARPELVIFDGEHRVTLRGRTLPFHGRGVTEFASHCDLGTTTFDGRWETKRMTGMSHPLIDSSGANMDQLIGAFTLMLRNKRQLRVEFGQTVRYGTMSNFDVAPWSEGVVEWRMQFRWEQASSVAPGKRAERPVLSLPGPGPVPHGQMVDETGKVTPKLSLVDTALFERDLEALARYLMDEHACTHPDGKPKVDPEAMLGVEGESGPAAAVRLLKLAAERGAFTPSSLANLYRDANELAPIRDLLHERTLRLSIAQGGHAELVDVVRGLIADAHVPSVDARDMAELRARAEAAEALNRDTRGRYEAHCKEMERAMGEFQERAKTAERLHRDAVDKHEAHAKDIQRLLEVMQGRIDEAKGEARLWRDRWQAHETAISDISRAYFEAGLGPSPASPEAITSALRRVSSIATSKP